MKRGGVLAGASLAAPLGGPHRVPPSLGRVARSSSLRSDTVAARHAEHAAPGYPGHPRANVSSNLWATGGEPSGRVTPAGVPPAAGPAP